MKFKRDITSIILLGHSLCKKSISMSTAYTYAIHFILIGIMKYKSTCIFG